MFLAFDIGNTNIVIGLFETPAKLLKTWRISTQPLRTVDEFRMLFHQLQILDFSASQISFEGAVLSSVVPPLTPVLKNALRGLTSKIFEVDSRAPFSFQIAAHPPEQVGADRLINAEAAVRDYGFPAIIVDSGTATTLCALDRCKETGKARYLGGAIMPGIELSLQALAKNTAKLYSVELLPPECAIGSNTQEALRSGILLGYASMIDGMVCRFREELTQKGAAKIHVIATGGVSELLQGLTKELEHFDPNLTLRGISYLYESFCR